LEPLLEGKNAGVYGAAARTFAREGAQVSLAGRTVPDSTGSPRRPTPRADLEHEHRTVYPHPVPEDRRRQMPGPQTLMTGISFGESPRWHDGRLWFSDWGTQEVIAVDPEGESEAVARVPSSPFCIDWLPDGSLATHADLSGLSERPWNDIVVDGGGNAYVGNIGFDFPGGEFAPGSVALVTPDGSARQVADGLAFPNGMVVTSDNSTLIVAESYGNRLTAFDIGTDGGLSDRRVWADLDDGVPDGICLDAEGAVWYADVPNSRCVRVREGGEVLQTIDLDRGCFACMLGGPEGKTLFMVAREWGVMEGTAFEKRTGQIQTSPAPAAGAGRP
jgi:sugar lactone lactonase YvrE